MVRAGKAIVAIMEKAWMAIVERVEMAIMVKAWMAIVERAEMDVVQRAEMAIEESAEVAIMVKAEMAPAYIQLAHHASPCWLALYFSYKHKYNTNINTNINIDHSASRAIILHPIVSLVHCSQSSQPTLVMIIV